MSAINYWRRSSDVLAVVPAYNEEGSIAHVIADLQRHGLPDILVIDDASLDHTAQVATRAGAQVLRLPFNLGIGGAVQAGFKYALELGYEMVLRVDGDGQHKVAEAQKLLQVVRAGQADVAIGSRFFPGQQTYTPPRSRAMGIRWFATMISLITRAPSYDTTSGMQAINRHAILILAENYPQDYPEVEARILLHKARLRVVEIPANMEPRRAGMSSITYLRAIYYLFKVTLATVLAALREPPPKPRQEV